MQIASFWHIRIWFRSSITLVIAVFGSKLFLVPTLNLTASLAIMAHFFACFFLLLRIVLGNASRLEHTLWKKLHLNNFLLTASTHLKRSISLQVGLQVLSLTSFTIVPLCPRYFHPIASALILGSETRLFQHLTQVHIISASKHRNLSSPLKLCTTELGCWWIGNSIKLNILPGLILQQFY